MDLIKIELTISVQRLKDLLVCAFEGGSNYWYDELEPIREVSIADHPSDAFYENLVNQGFNLRDKYTGKIHQVKPSTFESAFKRMSSATPKHFQDFMNENDDAETGDVFLQLLVFEKVIYG